MHFEVTGKLFDQPVRVRWADGVLSSTSDEALEILYRRASLVANDAIAPVSMTVGTGPPHLSDPIKLLFLLVYDTVFPPILYDGEVVEVDLPIDLPDGAVA